jgi:hypothetical protein
VRLKLAIRGHGSGHAFGVPRLPSHSVVDDRTLAQATWLLLDTRMHGFADGSSLTSSSFRSDTIIRIPVASLLRTPHVVLVDRGGAHGGEPIGCAPIK